MVLPYSVKPIIDDVIGKGDFSNLKLILVGVSASILISAIVSYALTILLSVEAQYLISVLRANVQKHLLRLPTRFFDNQQTGKLVSRVMTDVEGVRNLVGTGFPERARNRCGFDKLGTGTEDGNDFCHNINPTALYKSGYARDLVP